MPGLNYRSNHLSMTSSSSSTLLSPCVFIIFFFYYLYESQRESTLHSVQNLQTVKRKSYYENQLFYCPTAYLSFLRSYLIFLTLHSRSMYPIIFCDLQFKPDMSTIHYYTHPDTHIHTISHTIITLLFNFRIIDVHLFFVIILCCFSSIHSTQIIAGAFESNYLCNRIRH